MNYRHIYHAGNFADVLKHFVLVLCLEYLQRKDGALCVLDTHAGAGLYDLASAEAAKTGEWERGIGLLQSRADAPTDVQLYLNAVRADLAEGEYPGSPIIAARRLRPQDRLVAAELHEPTFETLRDLMRARKAVKVANMDAYECARAHLPPKERRGLVLIDPPFEEKDEFATLARQMQEWKRRWPKGVYLLWYPIKARAPVDALKDAARALGLPRTWFVETLVFPRTHALKFNGCGLIVFGAPFTVPERVESALPWLAEALSLHDTASGWLVADE